MKTELKCFACMVSAIEKMIKKCTDNEQKQIKLMMDGIERIKLMDITKTPVESANEIFTFIREKSGVQDPFYEMKRERNKKAWEILEKEITPLIKENQRDSLLTAVKVAVAGNILDAVAGGDHLLREKINHILNNPFNRENYGEFREELEKAGKILYIADNSGEIVFDRILVEELGKKGKEIVFCVRGGPAFDDALEEDFYEAKIPFVSKLVNTGTTYMGVVLSQAGEEFIREYQTSDLIIAKGMGNFETLSSSAPGSPPLFFLLQVKCEVVGRRLGVPLGSFCFVKHEG